MQTLATTPAARPSPPASRAGRLADGARWYSLTGMDEITGLGGTMLSAPFPAGTSPVTIASNPWQYDFPTPSTMLLLDSGGR